MIYFFVASFNYKLNDRVVGDIVVVRFYGSTVYKVLKFIVPLITASLINDGHAGSMLNLHAHRHRSESGRLAKVLAASFGFFGQFQFRFPISDCNY